MQSTNSIETYAYGMNNTDYITKEDVKEHNPN